jgi:hypothetical protein
MALITNSLDLIAFGMTATAEDVRRLGFPFAIRAAIAAVFLC